jgi:hypothetical protein
MIPPSGVPPLEPQPQAAAVHSAVANTTQERKRAEVTRQR